jgi:voltage-gated potassium channel
MTDRRPRNPNLALAIALLSIFSVINSFLAFIADSSGPRDVVLIVSDFLTVFFVLNFIYRLATAGSKVHYLVHGYGWLDLLACLPSYQISWAFRGLRAYVTLRHLTLAKIKEDVRRDGAEFALFVAVFLVTVIIEACSVTVLIFEGRATTANITTAQDALWWAYVTISTVGYGDMYPVTGGGRLAGIVLMTTGVGLFATIAGFLAHKLIYRRDRERSIATIEALKERMDEIDRKIGNLEKKEAPDRPEHIEGPMKPGN